ncbi:MAG: tetraacyldisaccharide 4'-kinase [Melioribacteraceae bacterium]|nr:tetraacyldisaccharide 4'-kinase [Melioribacteraceae bacterium]
MLKFFQILLSPFVAVYYLIIKVRNILFDAGIFKSEKVSTKIISVGNIVVGGAGKTPTVIYVLNILKKAGKKAGVLSRGYGRNSKGYKYVSDGEKFFTDVSESGDEIYLAANECGVAAAVSEKRVEGAKKFLDEQSLDAIVLDDAFQHRWIYRDIDILVFDQRFLNKVGKRVQNMLPLGVMREPFRSIARANIVIINRKFSDKTELPKPLGKYFNNKKVFYGKYKATGLYDVKNHNSYSLKEFQGQRSLVICGIARPYSFLNRLEQNKINIKNKILFPDHKEYTNKEVQLIRKKFYSTNANSVLTTQKDAVKLTKFSKELDDIDIYYLKIELEVENKEEFEKEIINIF